MITVKEIIKFCLRSGFKVERNKHIKVTLNNGKIIIISSTASDKSQVNQVLRDFRRHNILIDKYAK